MVIFYRFDVNNTFFFKFNNIVNKNSSYFIVKYLKFYITISNT